MSHISIYDFTPPAHLLEKQVLQSISYVLVVTPYTQYTVTKSIKSQTQYF